jgi:hypothetical protein
MVTQLKTFTQTVYIQMIGLELKEMLVFIGKVTVVGGR